MDEAIQLARNLRVLRRCQPRVFARIPDPALAGDDAIAASPASTNPGIHSVLDRGVDFLYYFGLDAPYHLIQIAPHIITSNRGILVIEPSWPVFLTALRQIDWRPLFRSKRIFWAVGECAREQVSSIMDETLCYAAAHPVYQLPETSATRDDADSLQTLLIDVKRESDQKKRALQERLNRLPELLRRPPLSPPRLWSYEDLRGLASFSTIQHTLMRTLHWRLRQLGYETEYVVLRDGEYYPPYYRILRMALFEPDLIFLCNRSPSYDTVFGAQLARSLPIPMLTWYADDPYYAEHLIERNGIAANERFLTADVDWRTTLQRYGAHEVGFMAGAATKTRRGRRRSRWICDIVFVGQVRDQRSFFAQLSSRWRDYCEKVICEKLRFPRKNVRAVMEQFELPTPLPTDRLDELRQKILWEANTRFRLRFAALACEFDFHLYGNDDWANLLPTNVHEKCFRGVLRRQRLFDAYRNARITLNIHSLQSTTCLNVRDFDVPAAGGFLLSDWLPRAEEVFLPGFVDDLPLERESRQEVFFYRTWAELKTLVTYFLTHEDERCCVIERARRRVLAENTYKHRAELLHDHIQRLIGKGP